MFHFFNTVTNIHGDSLPGYYGQVTDGSGNVIPIYSDDAGTAIATVSGIANMAKTDSDGTLSFYVPQGTYTLTVFGTDAATRYKTIANVSMGASTVTVSSGAAASSRAAMAAIANPAPNQAATLTESGREGAFVFNSSNLSAQVTADTAQGIYVAPSSDTTGASGAWVRKFSGAANAKWFGAALDGSTDDTTAYTTALAVVDRIFIPAGTSIVSSISVPANKVIDTAGHDTTIKQKSGTAANTRIISVTGSNVRIGDLSVEGQLNQAGDTTGEQNHGIFINASAASLSNISIGNVTGTNIRGDVVYVGQSGGNTVSQVIVGHVTGSNVYRNVVSVVSGSGVSIESVMGTQVGFYHLDVEPDVGAGTAKGISVGHIKGRSVGLIGPTAADYIDGVTVGHLDLDPSYTTGSTPAYTTTVTSGLTVRNLKHAHIEKAKINGFDGPGVIQVYNAGELAKQTVSFGELEITDCCKTDATNIGFVNGSPAVTLFRCETLRGTATTNKAVVLNCDNAVVESAEITTVASSYAFYASTKSRICNLNHSGAGIPFLSCDNLVAVGGTIAATATSVASFCSNIVVIGYTATVTTEFNTCTGEVVRSSINGNNYALNGIGLFQITEAGAITMPGDITTTGTGKIGYSFGGGTATQITSKSTGVTLNGAKCGRVTMNGAALAANTLVSFVLTNDQIGADNEMRVWVEGGEVTAGSYLVTQSGKAAGSRTINLRNMTAGPLSEAVEVGFSIVKRATA